MITLQSRPWYYWALLAHLLLPPSLCRATPSQEPLRPDLLSELVSIAYAKHPCDATCVGRLGWKLRASGPLAAVCAASLEGSPVWPLPATFSWLKILRSNLPVWGLFVRSGIFGEEAISDDTSKLVDQLLPHVRNWASNLKGGQLFLAGFASFKVNKKL